MPEVSNQALNPTAASILGFLQRGPMTGWELEKAVERSIGSFWNVTRSQIYRELGNLASSHLVEPGETGPRDRKPYMVTDAGRQAFAAWIGRPPGQEIIRFPLLLTMFFREHLEPARFRRYLREHELVHLRHLEEFEQQAEALGGAESGPASVLRFGIEYERAVLRWFASLPDYEPVEPRAWS